MLLRCLPISVVYLTQLDERCRRQEGVLNLEAFRRLWWWWSRPCQARERSLMAGD